MSEFTDAELISRFGQFNIRVYQETQGKETVVLWSKLIALTEPVLTRVHSECLTGDVFGSLHCDCGQQLTKSLRLFGKEGGVLIYLRQEGRGIGLFEKIKSYRLQSQGSDTVEANLKLGHNPDARSYEMVKTVLDDLNIKKIRLMTNNPSKVSDMSSLGIEILEVINLAVTPSKYNRSYLRIKKEKFSHFRLGEQRKYQYQFYASNPDCIAKIGLFLQQITVDPILKICAAIRLDHNGLHDQKKIAHIAAIIEACHQSQIIHPVLHFSFLHTKDYQSDLQSIQENVKNIEQIQLNDFDIEKLPSLASKFSSKKIDVSFSNSNFKLIKNSKIRDIIKKNRFLVILDESKGTGKNADFNQLRDQIDMLLAYGINRIGLAGGFGPDSLDTYLRLKRFYRINFSIDSETGVKTGGETDLNKVKVYLSQLLRSDLPKEEGIRQTKDFLSKNRRSEWETTSIEGHSFKIHPNVFHAGKFPSSAWFAKEVQLLSRNISSFCEVGCGAGVIACLTSLSNPTMKVVATDLNPAATENTKINVQSLGLSNHISIRQGDVLDSLQTGERFDLIFWALPFGFLDPGTSIDLEEAQVFDPGYRAIRKLIFTAKQHLTARGRLLLGFSSDLGHYELLQSIAREANASIKIVATTLIQEETAVQFELVELSYA